MTGKHGFWSRLLHPLRRAHPALLLGIGGCLTNLQQNVDLLIGHDALQNALVLPYSAVAGLARFLVPLL